MSRRRDEAPSRLIVEMPRHEIPPNIGKVRVAITLGNKYVVWNGKQGKHEFKIAFKNRKEATAAAAKINQMKNGGVLETG